MYDFLTDKILQNYADLMVNFAANERKGINPNDVCCVRVPESASVMLKYFQKSILKAGAIAVLEIIPEGLSADFYELANETQLKYHNPEVIRAKNNQFDHIISVSGTQFPLELKDADTKKIAIRKKALAPFYKEMWQRFDKNEASWTLCLFGTAAMAEQASMSLTEYWDQIIHACFLDTDNPVEHFQDIFNKIDKVSNWLNDLEIEHVHIQSENIDLKIKIGANRKWVGGSGHNIPSFEVFTSPDFRDVNGTIKFNQPLYYSGNVIRDIELKFENGTVVEYNASQNKHVLDEMLSHKGATEIGEFSLTDSRFSRITKFMANTLYDENVGGEFGNTHIAVGNSYKNCFKGDYKSKTQEQWLELGYNDSDIHTDIVSTEDRTVTAILQDGSELVIYRDGMFTLDLE
jgi:aminopeptidase